jgi:hypothetical protein
LSGCDLLAGQMPTLCASPELKQLFSLPPLLAAVLSESLPISPFALAPFSAVTLLR